MVANEGFREYGDRLSNGMDSFEDDELIDKEEEREAEEFGIYFPEES